MQHDVQMQMLIYTVSICSEVSKEQETMYFAWQIIFKQDIPGIKADQPCLLATMH